MSLLKKVELEWKLLLLSAVVLIALLFPLSYRFYGMQETLINSGIDAKLEEYLRGNYESLKGEERGEVKALLTRYLQWKALKDITLSENRDSFIKYGFIMFSFLMGAAFIGFRSIVRPINRLRKSVEIIGHGEEVDIIVSSGGSLGKFEESVKEMELELRGLRKRVIREAVEKTWRDSARVMAHEIRNPLTPMRLSIDRVEEQIYSNHEVKTEALEQLFSRLNSQLDILEGLVNRFRSFASQPEVNLKNIDLRDLTVSISEQFVSTFKGEVSGDAKAVADPSLLYQVILNILKNSQRAGATVVKIDFCEIDDRAIVTIEDNGCGIKSDKLDSLFLPYTTYSEDGSGIGLAVVKNLIEAMDGDVEIESQEGEYFKVIISLGRAYVK